MSSNVSSFAPDWYSPPSNSVNRILAHMGLSIEEVLSDDVHGHSDVAAVADGKLRITASIAKLLSESLGSSPEYWLKRQENFDQALRRCSDAIAPHEAREFLSALPVSDMKKFGWIPTEFSDLESMLLFFDVKSVQHWKENYSRQLNAVAFRQSSQINSSPASTVAWLRQSEILASKIKCKPWSRASLEKELPNIRSMSRRNSPKIFFPALVEAFARAGVALVFVRSPKGCVASGATKFLEKDKALIVLSFRHLADDHFWFTLFHEVGHLLLHSEKAIFLEDGSETTQHEEDEANEFASEILIPPGCREDFKKLRAKSKDIIRFARRVGIAPGIVVGQMQNLGLLDYSQQNSLKRRFNWQQLSDIS